MGQRKNNSAKKRYARKPSCVKEQAIRQVQRAGLSKEETESLIKEIEEISSFEDSLED